MADPKVVEFKQTEGSTASTAHRPKTRGWLRFKTTNNGRKTHPNNWDDLLCKLSFMKKVSSEKTQIKMHFLWLYKTKQKMYFDKRIAFPTH